MLFFHFGVSDHLVDLNIVPGLTPLIISRKDLNGMGLNDQKYYKTIDRPEDGYQEKGETGNYLPFLMFPQYGFLTTAELQNIQRSPCHLCVEKQMKIIEQVEIDYLPEKKEGR